MIFSILKGSDIDAAFKWQCLERMKTGVMRPLTREEFEALVATKSVWIVKDGDSEFVGIGHVACTELEERPSFLWEIGGVFINENCRGCGLSRYLLDFLLGYLLYYETPTKRKERVVVRVHEKNAKLGSRFSEIGFRQANFDILIPGGEFKGVDVNEDGNIVVHEYTLICPDALDRLAFSLAKWKEGTHAGHTVNLGEDETIEKWVVAIEELADLCRGGGY